MPLIINHGLATLDFSITLTALSAFISLDWQVYVFSLLPNRYPYTKHPTENPHARSINPESQLLWLSFFRMEMMYIEKLKARTRVLGFMKTKPAAVR
jgi:hypothetical protein